ncbi:MAG: hypothetical protein QOG54_844 [Actinomycetota bacterium]|nr:hypothetical protein [Actinomycetota bacterium]
MTREFDLNIEKVLEHWTLVHALREVIANALDERSLTESAEPEIFRDEEGAVHVRDFGRGLRYDHLTQNESVEKLDNPDRVVGKFGVGLKDALATFDRHDVEVTIRSAHADVTTAIRPKAGFPDVETLHALVDEASDPTTVGTDFVLDGDALTDDDVLEAKGLFLHYSGDEVLGESSYGSVLRPVGDEARIYVNGLRVATEENFLFSYNITSTTKALRQALNRERSHVGRTAYTDRVKSILLECQADIVIEALVSDLRLFERGTQHDETKWMDVALQACAQLNAMREVIFLTASELREAPDFLERAREDGYEPITIPDNVRSRLSKIKDAKGNPIRDLDRYKKEWNESFQFDFVALEELTEAERTVWNQLDALFEAIGGRPRRIKEVRVSTTMRLEPGRHYEAVGVWEPAERWIVIRRDQLLALESFAGTVLHETAHAISGASDVSIDFELALTDLLGKLGARKT